MAETLDGHIIFPNGSWQTTSNEDRRRMDKLREWSDALIVSRSTINNDNPILINRSKPQKRRQPSIQVLMQKTIGTIRSDAKIFSSPHHWGNFWINSPNKNWNFLSSCTKDEINFIEKHWKIQSFAYPNEILSYLFKSGYKKILLEGGPKINGLFLSSDLIDEIFLTKVPWAFGGKSNDRLFITDTMIEPKKFRLRKVQHRKNELFLHYTRYPKKSSTN